MRLLLGTALILLFLWLQESQTSSRNFQVKACETVSLSEASASLLLSPLSLYSWMVSTLLRVVLSVPALLLTSLSHSLLLLLAVPWCFASVCFTLLLTCLYVALYLLHLALVVGALVILTFGKHKMADGRAASDKVWDEQRRATGRQTPTKRVVFGRRVAHQA